MAAANSLSTLHPHLDDLIAKFVHQPKYDLNIRYVSYRKDGKDIEPYTDQSLTEGYLIILGSVEIAKGATIKINQDISKPTTTDESAEGAVSINSMLHFFDGETGIIYLSPNCWFLKRKLNQVKLKIGDCSMMVFDLNDHPWIYDMVKLLQQATLFHEKPSS